MCCQDVGNSLSSGLKSWDRHRRRTRPVCALGKYRQKSLDTLGVIGPVGRRVVGKGPFPKFRGIIAPVRCWQALGESRDSWFLLGG